MQPYPVFTKKYILLGILIFILNGWECQPMSENSLRRSASIRFNKSKELRLTRQSPAYDNDEDGDTREYPSAETFFQEEYSLPECGKNYHLADVGYVYFNLGPGQQPCHYGFFGSKMQHCTAGVFCPGVIALKPKSKRTKRCEDEYLVLSDSTDGEMMGCGEFSFHKTPRYSRNGGSNLYVRTKGHAYNSRCIAMCVEDLARGMFELKPPQPLSTPETHISQDVQWTMSQCKCGIRRNYGRIVGGEAAFENEFPWIAAFVLPGTRKSLCAGSLINSRYILTAAHCFEEEDPTSEFEILLHAHVVDRNLFVNWTEPTLINVPGWNLPRETDESENSIRLKIMEVHMHPKFDDESFLYDYAILKLAHPVDLVDSHVAPICLPKQKLSYQDGETIMTVAGWGVPWENGPANSRLLQKLDVPYVSNKLCRRYTNITESHLCAGYLEGGKDACQGDSGGPLIYLAYPDTNQYVLSGVVSAGYGCARKSQLGWYSDVKKVLRWIHSIATDGTWCDR